MEALTQSTDVSVAVHVQSRSTLSRAVPHYTLQTLETACRVTLGVLGVLLMTVGSLCRVLAEPLSVAGRTALIIARGEDE